ncbi:MAG: type II toxin-antitoxin system HicA family toxin [Desulfobacter postgatei]|jgi:predicted RNA binding protein YcfA (HicA-like mRNA interferase family)|uniref:type II toxin-antitoxin system HicA family toxin n=1 Tax=Desulfobacter postgatei TaxID=2293 RepID=UPI003C6C2F36|nr:type II toxin-antitoxin system HicA family toxin [Desulfobacter postgatei]
MKRKDLISKIISMGCVFLRYGSNHDLYQNPKTGKKQPVPRHREIDEQLAKHILKELA